MKDNNILPPWAKDDNRVFIIAEIGKNFIQTPEDQPVEEYLRAAKELIDLAVEAGADAVKFQTHEVEDEQANINIVAPHFSGMDRYNWVKRNTLGTPLSFWQELKDYATKRGIIFFSTPMSRLAAKKLEQVGVPFWKVGSGDVDDYLLMDYLLSTKKPIIFSSGMVSLEELDTVISNLNGRGSHLTVLYCISQYPCPPEHFNLATIEHLREKYPSVSIGFSDHSVADQKAALAAVKLGARIIEKHFSLSRDLWGSDHKASLTPVEFAELVRSIRQKEYEKIDPGSSFGEKERELEGAHNMFRPFFKKTLVAARDLPVGHQITPDDLYAQRPQAQLNGIPASGLRTVLGRSLVVAKKKFEPIKNEDVI